MATEFVKEMDLKHPAPRASGKRWRRRCGFRHPAGVRWEEADRAAAMAEARGTLAGLRDAAIVSVVSDALPRVAEISTLDVADVDLSEQTVLIRRSKIDQEARGVAQYLGEPTVQRVRAWVGGAQSLASAGASLVEMQLADRWESPVMPGRYAQGQIAQQGAVARLRYGK